MSLDVRAIDEKDLPTTPFPKVKHEYRVFLSEAAFDRAVERGGSDTSREIGGVLVGEVLRDEAGPYLHIDGTVDALHADEKGAELTFTHATWEHIHKEMDSKHKHKKVVGWYHTHPGFGIFLSDRDQFIHKSFFNLPFQVALVYDPKSREHGLFAWRDNEVWRMRRYWIGGREQLWDGARVAEDRTEPARERDVARPAAEPPNDDLHLPGSLVSLAVIGLALLLLGGFVGHWLGAASASEIAVAAQAEIVKAKAEGQQLAITALQRDLVDVLRDTLGDEAIRAPVSRAITELDGTIASLGGPARAAERAAGGVATGSAGTATSGSGAGSAAGSASGAIGGSASGAAAKPSAVAATSPKATSAGPSDPRLAEALAQLEKLRAELVRLRDDRGSARATLHALELAASHTNELREDLAHDVAEQRSGVGALYAELASDAVKAKDLDRARRLLAAAAHLDPGNRARYEKQLHTFDKSASLPAAPADDVGSPDQGASR